MPLAIRRTRKNEDGSRRLVHTRGPFLTESTYEDGGHVQPIVVELSPTHLTVRQRGRREAMPVTYERIYLLAAQIAAADHARKRNPDAPVRRRVVSRGAL